MKKILLLFILLLLLVIFRTRDEDIRISEKKNEKRAIFISYIELEKYVNIKNTTDSKKNIENIINNVKNSKFNMIILQVRPFSDAIYKSNIFPWSSVVGGEEGTSPGFDVLSYFIKEAHKQNIELHAWVNPYRVRLHSNVESITKENPAFKWLETNNIEITDDGIYYNPASSDVTKLILDGIEEIVSNYDVDGILFDDYFYMSDTIDQENYKEYSKDHDISLRDYRLMVVNNLVEEVKKVTEKNNILFGISPEGNIENDYNKNYADVYKWGESNSYVDYLMPQLYYGFYNEAKPFYDTLKEWEKLVESSNVSLMPALSLYKSGNLDNYAKGGINEWIENDDILMRQILISGDISHYDGFAIYRYDSMFSNDINSQVVLSEIKNIKSIIND